MDVRPSGLAVNEPTSPREARHHRPQRWGYTSAQATCDAARTANILKTRSPCLWRRKSRRARNEAMQKREHRALCITGALQPVFITKEEIR